jgi:hypothetical protein
LVIKEATVEDSGMYICFVTNSGFGALTYKSMHLTVIKSKGELIVFNVFLFDDEFAHL